MERNEAIQRLRSELIERRNCLSRALFGSFDELGQPSVSASGNVMDAAIRADASEVTAALATNSSSELARVEYALERIRQGRHDICESCGKQISQKRLMALPGVIYCFDCQKKMEQQEPRQPLPSWSNPAIIESLV
jgi:DnaK suppressor protein